MKSFGIVACEQQVDHASDLIEHRDAQTGGRHDKGEVTRDRHLEEAGQVRRGWFVEGLSGAQFASPGAADRLREARGNASGRRAPEVRLLASLDPASPWGAQLPWPTPGGDGGPRPRRAAGARLVTVDGEATLFLPAAGKRLTTFGEAPRVATALERLPELHHRRKPARRRQVTIP